MRRVEGNAFMGVS